MEGKYIINGIGEITYDFYGKADEVVVSKDARVLKKLSNINQLGSIKIMYNGANYTRLEYLLLQVSLVNLVKESIDNGLGSVNKKVTEQLGSDKLTGGEILQLLFIFSNVGHLKDTFSANKVIMHLLKENKYKLKSSFKKGLKGSDAADFFDDVITKGDYHKIQWLNSIFLINRTKYAYLSKLIKIMINEEYDKDLINLFSRIRQLSYIVLDLNYSRLPIDFNLYKLLHDKNMLVDQILQERSALFSTLDTLNDLLQESLYMENNALLGCTQRSFDLYNQTIRYMEQYNNPSNIAIAKIKDLLTDDKCSPFYRETKWTSANVPWNKNLLLSITYNVEENNIFPNDIFKQEFDIKNKLGQDIYLAYHFSPSHEIYREVYSIKQGKYNAQNVNKILNIASSDYLVYQNGAKKITNNGKLNIVVVKKLLTYLFRNILKEDYYCKFQYKEIDNFSPFIVTKGTKSALRYLNKYIERYIKRNPNDKDFIHELNAVKSVLETQSYKGLIIVYAGSLTFSKSKEKDICELDGVILYPNRKKGCVRIIEAKNTRSKYSTACKQQKENLLPIFREGVVPYIGKLPDYGSMVVIDDF